MELARVIGRVVCEVKYPTLKGIRLVVVQPVDHDQTPVGDPIIAAEHIITFGWASADELDVIYEDTLRINDFLTGLFHGIGVRLIDFKLEFGRAQSDDGVEVLLADEISPDNCRLWDAQSNEKMDKDRFRRDLGGLIDAYQEIARRLGVTVPRLT